MKKMYQAPCAALTEVFDDMIRTSGWDENNKEDVVKALDEWF